MTTATINNKAYEFVGTTDEVTTCGCCGRDNLKMTIVLRPFDGGDFVHFGSQCGAKALSWSVKEVNTTAKDAIKERRKAINAAQFNHPLHSVINKEIEQCNGVTPRMPYSERSVWMARWSEMRNQIDSDVAAQFGITVEKLRAGKVA